VIPSCFYPVPKWKYFYSLFDNGGGIAGCRDTELRLRLIGIVLLIFTPARLRRSANLSIKLLLDHKDFDYGKTRSDLGNNLKIT
jgi:hypothetical protein